MVHSRNNLLFGLCLTLTFPTITMGEWVHYSTEDNGDLSFYNKLQTTNDGDVIFMPHRRKYKTSVMGSYSREIMLRFSCNKNIAYISKSTFFLDNSWKKPAMPMDKTSSQTIISPKSKLYYLLRKFCKKIQLELAAPPP